MLETIDMELLKSSKKFLNLKDYKIDGTLTYCDTTDLEYLLSETDKLIDKTITARLNNNWRVLTKISEYSDNTLVRGASVNFYEIRNLYSEIFYLIQLMKKQQVYYMNDISIIPKEIKIDNSILSKSENIAEIYSSDNADIDMLADKIFLTFYKYFHVGQIPMNDAEAVLYSFTLLSVTASIRDKVFYDFIKNVFFIYSTFICFDRLFQFKDSLKKYLREKEFYLSSTRKIETISWLSSPRKENIEFIYGLLEKGILESDYHRLILLIRKHISYIDTVKNLDPNIIVDQQG